MKLYKLVANEEQLKCISRALESYTRLGIGQLENVLFDLGFREHAQFSDRLQEFHSKEVEEAIKTIKHKIFDMSFNASHSIHHKKVHENFKVCWEMFSVVRNTLALINKPEGGMSVDFDSPANITKHGLIRIELIGEDDGSS